ncbi:MAG: DUF2164 family protein [Culicoidibacterales bacterium]
MHKPIKFEKAVETHLTNQLQTYFEANLEPITQLQAYLLLDFINQTVGAHCYNLAIEDSYTYLQTTLDDLYILQKDTTAQEDK